MKIIKRTVFSLICAVIGSALHLLCQLHGIFFAALSGFILGIIIAFALLSFEPIKNYFLDIKKNKYCGYDCECCWAFPTTKEKED